MAKQPFQDQHTGSRGQSLVEVALFIPLALMIIAGIVEVGQWLVTQNRVSTAAREATRFGANGGNNENMAIVALNTVTETMPLDSDRWDIFSIRGTVNDTGTGIDNFEFVSIYGQGLTRDYTQVGSSAFQGKLEQDVLTALQRQKNQDTLDQASAADIDFVGTYAVFDAESILGLDYFVEDMYSVRDLNVMRVFPSNDAAAGCSAFPIAVQKDVRSVIESGSGDQVFPAPGDFSYPSSDPPVYTDFPYHQPNVPLDENTPSGTVYRIWEGGGTGNFGWLSWNTDVSSSEGTLVDSLRWPGNSINYQDTPNGANNGPSAAWRDPGFSHPVYGYIEPKQDPSDPPDTQMHVGDYIAGLTGVVNSGGSGNNTNTVNGQLQQHINGDRQLRLVIWDTSSSNGSNLVYKIYGFAVFKIHGYRLSQGSTGSWILAEFIRWDDTCGQAPPTP